MLFMVYFFIPPLYFNSFIANVLILYSQTSGKPFRYHFALGKKIKNKFQIYKFKDTKGQIDSIHFT